MIRKQFTLYIENRPGELAKVTTALAKADVNIEGISVAEGSDVALVQMVVSNASATKRALTQAKVPFTVQDVAVLHLENRPGALSEVAVKLAKGGININYVYATACEDRCGCSSRCYAIVSSPELKKIEKMKW